STLNALGPPSLTQNIRQQMNNNLHNYECWFKGVVRHLYNDVNAGFAILMIAIPLLERYLRQKSGAFEGDLNDAFYREFLAVFPSLANISEAKDFWQVYRNGLLHQVTLSRANR